MKIKLILFSVLVFAIMILSVFFIVEQKNILLDRLLDKALVFSEYTTKIIFSTYSDYLNEQEKLNEIFMYLFKDEDLDKFLIVNDNNKIIFENSRDGNSLNIKDFEYQTKEYELTIRKTPSNIIVISPYIDEAGNNKYFIVFYFSINSVDKLIQSSLIKFLFIDVVILICGFLIIILISKGINKEINKKT